jgi:hypothetical protein
MDAYFFVAAKAPGHKERIINILVQRARLWVTPGRGCFPESQTS